MESGSLKKQKGTETGLYLGAEFTVGSRRGVMNAELIVGGHRLF